MSADRTMPGSPATSRPRIRVITRVVVPVAILGSATILIVASAWRAFERAPAVRVAPVVVVASQSVQAGRAAFLAGAMQAQDHAQPSTPVLGTPFWHQA